MKPPNYFNYLSVSLAIVFLMISFYNITSTYLFINSSESHMLQGKVVAHKSYMRYREDIIACVIETTFYGDTLQTISDAFKEPLYQINDKVELIYNQDKNDLRINTHMDIWGYSYAFLSFSIFLFIVPFLATILSSIKKRT